MWSDPIRWRVLTAVVIRGRIMYGMSSSSVDYCSVSPFVSVPTISLQGQHINTHHLQFMGKKFVDALLMIKSRHNRPSITALDLASTNTEEQPISYVLPI